jgi:hypothetical protein
MTSKHTPFVIGEYFFSFLQPVAACQDIAKWKVAGGLHRLLPKLIVPQNLQMSKKRKMVP